MSVELGRLFDTAVEHIRRARSLASDDGYTGALLASTLDILIQLDIYSRELNWDEAGEEGEPAAMVSTSSPIPTVWPRSACPPDRCPAAPASGRCPCMPSNGRQGPPMAAAPTRIGRCHISW